MYFAFLLSVMYLKRGEGVGGGGEVIGGPDEKYCLSPCPEASLNKV